MQAGTQTQVGRSGVKLHTGLSTQTNYLTNNCAVSIILFQSENNYTSFVNNKRLNTINHLNTATRFFFLPSFLKTATNQKN